MNHQIFINQNFIMYSMDLKLHFESTRDAKYLIETTGEFFI